MVIYFVSNPKSINSSLPFLHSSILNQLHYYLQFSLSSHFLSSFLFGLGPERKKRKWMSVWVGGHLLCSLSGLSFLSWNEMEWRKTNAKRERASKGARNKQRSPNQQRMRASGGWAVFLWGLWGGAHLRHKTNQSISLIIQLLCFLVLLHQSNIKEETSTAINQTNY